MVMSTVEEIEQAIEKLSPQDHKRLMDWLDEHYWAKWDQQIEEDSAAGRLDHVLEQVKADIAAGRTRPL